MKKRFIVLVDFSESSHHLVKYANEWALQEKAEILLLHEINPLLPMLTDLESKSSILQEENAVALVELSNMADQFTSPFLTAKTQVIENNLTQTLNELVLEPFENLIFIGLKESSLFEKYFIKNRSLQIIENTKNTVIAIPQEIKTYAHDQIFVAVSDKHPLNLVELHNFFKFIDIQNSVVTFFYLAKPNEETAAIERYLQDLKGLFSEQFNTHYAIYETNHPHKNIKKVINNTIDEILVVQKGSRLLTDLLFRKFLINELIHEGETPLVILP